MSTGAFSQEAAALECYLAEYGNLTEEIRTRQRHIFMMLALGATVIISLLSVIIARTELQVLILGIPLIICVFGFHFVSEFFMIAKIGRYILGEIRPALLKLTASPDIMGWEVALRRVGWADIIGGAHTALLTLLLLGLSVGSLMGVWHLSPKVIEVGWNLPFPIWLLGAVLTVILSLCWVSTYFYWRGGVGESRV